MKPRRYIAVYAMLVAVVVVIVMRLVNMQIANGNNYREKSDSRTLRSVEFIAPRGEILDRNGRPIVTNRTAYNVYILSSRSRTADELNRVICNLSIAVKDYDEYVKTILPVETVGGGYAFKGEEKDIKKWKENNGFEE